MIRILQVVTHMNRGGLETMLMNYYRHMDRTNVQFDFLTHREYDGDYGKEINELGGKIYHLPVLNPFSCKYKNALRNFFMDHQEYEIIHVHQDCLSSVILKVAKECNVKIRIAHSHCSSQDMNMKYPVKMYYQRLIPKYATELMACGDDAGTWMFRGASFKILNNAIDAKKYRFNTDVRISQRKKWGVKPDEILIGHVGRFSLPKNHSFLIDIFENIQSTVSARLILIGDEKGELASRVKEKVAKLRLQDKVIFAGLRSDVADLMQAMDVFVFPSNYEGFPVTLVEAQAAGLPCLISDKVPIECKMTNLIYQIPLATSPEIWAKKAIEAAKQLRKNTYEEIKVAGYDIVESAKRLQKMYEEMMQR